MKAFSCKIKVVIFMLYLYTHSATKNGTTQIDLYLTGWLPGWQAWLAVWLAACRAGCLAGRLAG